MHARDRLLDRLVRVLELAVLVPRVAHLLGWRVSVLNHLVMLRHAIRAKRLVVRHAETFDGLVVPPANRVLQNLVHRGAVRRLHPSLRPLPTHIVIHFYLIALLVIDRGK